ncbi:MAG TPA: anthranilate synthase component I [Actinobacteria bacterium]|nr:anthranilate synthase component I [Actinomycetes bacterium]HEX21151.1 anthranilate synthase component I [Actinomycetota bacterium]
MKNYSITKKQFKNLAVDYNLIPIYRDIIVDADTPVSAFVKLAGGDNSFLLESVEGGELLGRYSFIGVNSFLMVSCRRGQVTITGEKEEILNDIADPLVVIEGLMKEYRSAPLPGLPPFFGGAVGYVGYDSIRYFESIPRTGIDDLNLPEMRFIFTDTVVIFDHLKHRVKVLVNARSDGNNDKNYELATERIEEIIVKLRAPVTISPLSETGSSGREISANMSKDDFMRAVRQVKEYILAGDILQTVISQRFSMPVTTDPFDIYRVLRTINPSPYLAYIRFTDMTMIASSPEPLVKVDGDFAITRPIAGTRRRGDNEQEDRRLADELLNDVKERAEHIMLVDLGRNDLGRVCRPGTVKVDDLMFVEHYSHVMHIVSQVSGILAADKSAYDLLRAAFPAGTVSGAPKIRAMEIIDELEPNLRGPYAGVFGYFSFSGNLDTGITIRTIVVVDNVAYVQAGAGIVADSDPEAEYKETLNKAKAALKAVEVAEAQTSA